VGAFVVAVITGSLLFSSNAPKYAHNVYFQAKMALLVLAAGNMMVFHLIGARDIVRWDATAATPIAAKTAGGISLLVWIAVVVCGRWIASHCTSPPPGISLADGLRSCVEATMRYPLLATMCGRAGFGGG